MHQFFFGLDPGERLSGRVTLDPLRAFVVPCLGGLLFGLVTAYITRRRGTEVDPIEANALHGGRMSMRGSLIVAAQTVWSSGVGASVGLEAGYTQIAQRHRLGHRACRSGCAEATCASWSAAARRPRLPARSVRRSAALFTASN